MTSPTSRRARRLVQQDLDGRADCQSGDPATAYGEVRVRPADVVAQMRQQGTVRRDGSGYDTDLWRFRPEGSSRSYDVSVPRGPDGEFQITVHRRWLTWIG